MENHLSLSLTQRENGDKNAENDDMKNVDKKNVRRTRKRKEKTKK